MNDLNIDAPPFHNDTQWIQVQTLLRQMIALLIDTDTHNWASELERLRLVFSNDPAQARYEITRLYGGSGSLNDLILYKNGALLIAENNHFHELRRALYDVITAAKNG